MVIDVDLRPDETSSNLLNLLGTADKLTGSKVTLEVALC